MTSETGLELRQNRPYMREFLPAVVGYVIVLAGSLAVVGDEVTSVGEWIVAMLPIVPALWGVRAVVRQVRRIDEYQRLIQLESMATGFGVAMIASITVGFVGAAGTATVSAGWIVYSAGMLAWGVTLKLRSRA